MLLENLEYLQNEQKPVGLVRIPIAQMGGVGHFKKGHEISAMSGQHWMKDSKLVLKSLP